MRFTKMHGIGNDYVYIDLFQETLPNRPEIIAPLISDRHFGVGGDGLVLICPSDVADARMRMFNADGSESEMCGNAIRCVAKYVAERRNDRPERLRIATGAGILTLECFYEANRVKFVRVNMGIPVLKPELVPTNLRLDIKGERAVCDLPVSDLKIDFSSALGEGTEALTAFLQSPLSCVSMGNPHCIIFVSHITDDLVHKCGPLIERSLNNFPRKVNVEFIERISDSELKMRVWERGSGETLACGTGACASVVASVLTARTKRDAKVKLQGGELDIEWNEKNNCVFMTGPAEEVMEGELEADFVSFLATLSS